MSTYPGSTNLFHVLLGVVDRDSTNNGQGTTNLGCFEHAIQPYFTAQDLSDWQMVTITSTGTPIVSYNLPALRTATTLPSRLPRVSFFTTPAFLAVWNTNDSNQHRVTANQALLAALGQGFTNATTAFPAPPSSVGLDGAHAVAGTTCFICHKSLDPMRLFWQNQFDFNDQVPARVASTAASFGFGDVMKNGASLVDFGTFLGQVTDTQVAGAAGQPLRAGDDAAPLLLRQLRRLRRDRSRRCGAWRWRSRTPSYNFKTLVRELFSSPLVTAWASTATFVADGVTISVARRDQLCAALSNRLGKADLCEIAMPTPTGVTTRDQPPGRLDPGRRLQPRLAAAGDPARSEPVLSRGQRAGVRGGGRQGGRRTGGDQPLHQRHRLGGGDHRHGGQGDGPAGVRPALRRVR